MNDYAGSFRDTLISAILITVQTVKQAPCEVRLSPLGTATTTGLLYQPQMIDDGNC
jgi:hypothetical protein